MAVKERIDELKAEALSAAAAADSTAALEEVRVRYLGRSAEITRIKKSIGSLEPEERKEVGRTANLASREIENAIRSKTSERAAEERAERLQAEAVDVTLPGVPFPKGHLHPSQRVIDQVVDFFVGLGYRVAEGPEVETDWHNFGALNMGPTHPARSDFDTLFVDHAGGEQGRTMLRTHTSPVQIRAMLAGAPPIYIVAPGRVFRRDTPDATHMPVFHQIEGLVVDRDIALADLAGTIEAFTQAFFGPGFTSRLRPSYFPFTEPSGEFDIRTPSGDWLELGGCGMVHPNVLRAGGIDPEEWSGFAFGFGIDRMAKERHEVGDLREMFTGDIRFAEQF